MLVPSLIGLVSEATSCTISNSTPTGKSLVTARPEGKIMLLPCWTCTPSALLQLRVKQRISSLSDSPEYQPQKCMPATVMMPLHAGIITTVAGVVCSSSYIIPPSPQFIPVSVPLSFSQHDCEWLTALTYRPMLACLAGMLHATLLSCCLLMLAHVCTGKRAKLWATFNEPGVAAMCGWIAGNHPPGKLLHFRVSWP